MWFRLSIDKQQVFFSRLPSWQTSGLLLLAQKLKHTAFLMLTDSTCSPLINI